MREQSLVRGNWFAVAVLCAAAAFGCGTRGVQGQQGGETNFLSSCDTRCDDGLACIDGICTLACDRASDCDDLDADATCTADGIGADAETVCDVGCSGNGDCRDLGSDHRCEDGFCRAPAMSGENADDDPSGGAGGSSSEGGGAGGTGSGSASEGGTQGGVVPLDDESVVYESPTGVDKVDLLFMIDNSISMADKQTLLSQAVSPLIQRLVNPWCIDGQGNASSTSGPDEQCPAGASREFPPFKDIHVGIITSSIGDAGANIACAYNDSDPDSVQKVDNGYLLGSLQRGGASEPGFLSWTGSEGDRFGDSVRTQVLAAGEFGCGYEAPMEAWYHFLVDPTPWMSIDTIDCAGQAAGSGNCRRPNIPMNDDGTFGDPFILRQRSLFLRPDSLVAVVMLTDENDCSIIAGGPFNLVAQTNVQMFRGSDQCAADSNDACCYSCGTGTPAGCTDGCTEATGGRFVALEQDEPNLRCYEQKRRFGLDFLYPTQRYVNALTQTQLGTCRVDLDPAACAETDLARNPLFLGAQGTLARDPSRVILAGIVGVPWQLIQATTNELGEAYPQDELHFLTAQQLEESTLGFRLWDSIVGDPTVRDPHMLEAIASAEVPGRPGLPTLTTGAGSDEIHGHEWLAESADDLQYACTFPLPEPRDCDGADFANGKRGCDCRGAGDAGYTEGNPLCYNDGAYSSVQVAAKAYPGLRELETLRAFGDVSGNAIVGSICPRNVTGDPLAQDFGYNPMVSALVDRIKGEAPITTQCLSSALELEEVDGEARGKPVCRLVEVSSPPAEGCSCDPDKARTSASDELDELARTRLLDRCLRHPNPPPSCDASAVCVCELVPAGGEVGEGGTIAITDVEAYADCQSVDAPSVDGWCYVDQDVPVITGDETAEAAKDAFVRLCPEGTARTLRFVGDAAPVAFSQVLSLCTE